MLNDDRTPSSTFTPRPSLRCHEFLRANDQIRVHWSLAEIRQDSLQRRLGYAWLSYLSFGSIRSSHHFPAQISIWHLKLEAEMLERMLIKVPCLALPRVNVFRGHGHFALFLAGCVAGLANSRARMEAKCKGSCSTCTTLIHFVVFCKSLQYSFAHSI